MAGNLRARVVLQNRDSLLYFKGEGQWTPDISKAVDFERLRHAREMAREIKKGNLEIVMTFGEPRYDVRFNIWP